MTKKDECKILMTKFFGPTTASLVDGMKENDCVKRCKAKVEGFLGEEYAEEFDKIK